MSRIMRAAVAALTAALVPLGAGTAHAGAPDSAVVGAIPPTVAAAGEHKLVVLPVYWTAPDAQTTASLRALARQVGDYWSEQTNARDHRPRCRHHG